VGREYRPNERPNGNKLTVSAPRLASPFHDFAPDHLAPDLIGIGRAVEPPDDEVQRGSPDDLAALAGEQPSHGRVAGNHLEIER
jgi:hypothetical protein